MKALMLCRRCYFGNQNVRYRHGLKSHISLQAHLTTGKIMLRNFDSIDSILV